MKKFLPYLLILLVLGGAASWFFWQKFSDKGDTEGMFAIKDRKEVSKIVLVDTEKKKIELTKVNGAWMVNGKFVAREELLQNLFEVLTRITTLSPVPKAAHDNVLREMLERSVKVDIYGANASEPIKSYYVGGPTVEGDGTYMLLEENGKTASRPYIAYIPGQKGYVTPRYTTDEENWREKILFATAPQDIQSLSVEYTVDEKNSFIINKVAVDSFTVQPLDGKFKINGPYEQKYIRQYLAFYSSLSFEAFDNDYSKKDSIIHTTPYCTIILTDKDNKATKVNLFHMPLSKRSKTQFDEKGEEMTYDLDHFHAAINNDKDLVISQYYVLGKVLRNYKDFYFKPGEAPKP